MTWIKLLIHSRSLALCLLIGFAMQVLARVATTIEISPSIIADIRETYGRRAGKRVQGWNKLLHDDKKREVQATLKRVNSFFNRTRYKTDLEHWGVEDYWAAPLESLSTNGSDCEDYAIAKYFTLLALGIPDEDLRLTYVIAVKLGQAHMVLTYYGDNKMNPLVLDNLEPWIRPASERTDLEPVYSFNGGGLWMSREKGRGELSGKAEDLDQWAKLLTRLPPEYLAPTT